MISRRRKKEKDIVERIENDVKNSYIKEFTYQNLNSKNEKDSVKKKKFLSLFVSK